MEEDFFNRGRQLAKAADRGEHLPDERIIGFEDPAEVMKLITAARLALLRAVKVLPGHGRMKEVRATANRFSLQAEVA